MHNTDHIIDFIGIGAPKCATTWIAACLSDHPEVCMAQPKEVNYFLDPAYSEGERWYTAHFRACGTDQKRGEYSPNYLHNHYAAARIHKTAPHAKLLLCLRDPVERAASAERAKIVTGRKSHTQTAQAAGLNETALTKGLYATHLAEWLRYFPREHIGIFIYEDIQQDPVAFMRSVYAFLGMDTTFVSAHVSRRENVSGKKIRSHLIQKILYRLQRLTGTSRYRHTLLWLGRRSGVTALLHSLRRLNTRDVQTTAYEHVLSDHERRTLYEYYKKDIAKLEQLLGRTLTSWHRHDAEETA